MKELRILSPCGILGYGFPKESFLTGVSKKPDIIAVDAGSTDAGPHKLGAGVGIVSKQATKKDLELMLKAGFELKIPVVIGSAGGSGAKPHVEWTMQIIKEICEEQQLHFKTAIIWADIDKSYIKTKMKKGDVAPLGPAPELTEEALDLTTDVVSQMGHEPIIEALDKGAQLIVAGRCYDPSVFAAYAIHKGYDPGLAYHLGKILECGALCAEPGTTKDCIMGYLREDHFLVEPMNPKRKCYITTVAAHTLYEKEHPYHLFGPGLELDLSGCTFEQQGDGVVKAAGSKFIKPREYYLKMEGAAKVAYRTLVIAGIRDPIMIQNIEAIKAEVIEQVAAYFEEIPRSEYQIIFHLYGKDGVMGPLEPVKETKSHELGMVMEVVASTQDLANVICSSARSTMMHYGYKGRKSTAGNLAFLYSPSDIVFGPVYKFTVYHLMRVDHPCELVKFEYLEL
ncbi:MAG TPA: acyclic terpene utilization AtuA family protein [Clostridia bacterium]|nr:acyclic terpene utilization AtuA family protein [Clostridia bacterium]